jgi:hypothetical protein
VEKIFDLVGLVKLSVKLVGVKIGRGILCDERIADGR